MATLDATTAVAAETPATTPVNEPVLTPVVSEAQTRAHIVWAVGITSVLLATLLLLKWLPAVAWPLVIAIIGAYLLDPVVSWMAKRNVSRPFASAVLIGAGAFMVIGAVMWGLPRVLEQAARLPHQIRTGIDVALARLSQFDNKAMPEDFEHLLTLARDHVPDIVSNVLPGAGSVVSTLVGSSLSALSFVLSALIVPVVGYYLLKGWPDVVASVGALLPVRQRPFIRERMKEVDRVLNGFIRGQLTMAAVLAVLYASSLSLAGLKLAVVIGLITGFGNLVPYVGTATGISLAVVSCLVDFGINYHLAVVLVVFLTIMTLDSILITPRIVGNRVGLSPAAVIVSVLTCGSLFGFGGVLLAVPTVAILKVVLRVTVQVYRQSRLYLEG